MIPTTCYGNPIAYWSVGDKEETHWNFNTCLNNKFMGQVKKHESNGGWDAWYWHDCENEEMVCRNGFKDAEEAKAWMESKLEIGAICESRMGKFFEWKRSEAGPFFELQIYDCIDEKMMELDSEEWNEHYDITDWINSNDMAAFVWNTSFGERINWESNRSYPKSFDPNCEEDEEMLEAFTMCVDNHLRDIMKMRRELAPSIISNIREEWESIVKDKPWKGEVSLFYLDNGDDITFEYDPGESDLGREQLRDYVREAIFALEDGTDWVRIREIQDASNSYKVEAYVLCQ